MLMCERIINLIFTCGVLFLGSGSRRSFVLGEATSGALQDLDSSPTDLTNKTFTTNNPNFETIRADIGNLSCSVLLEYSSWTFAYKYSREEIRSAMCRCWGTCVQVKIDQSVMDSIQDYLYNPLSEINRLKFIIVISVFGFMFLVGCTGNIIVLVGLVKWMKHMSPTFAFVMSLCVCDLMILCVSMPIKVIEEFRLSDDFPSELCKVSYYIRDLNLVCTVLTHAVISFERYYAICRPMEVQYICTWKRAKAIIAVTWLLSCGLAVPTIFMMKFFNFRAKLNECLPMSDEDLHVLLFFIYYFAILFVVPSILMTFTYGRSSYMLWKSTLITEKLQGNSGKQTKHKESESVQSRRKVIKLLIVVVVLFVVCWGPLFLVMILDFYRKIGELRHDILLLAAGLCYLSSSVNPYLFMSMSSQFGRLKTFCKKCRRRQQDVYTTQESDVSVKTSTTSASGGEELRSVTCEECDPRNGDGKDKFNQFV